MYNTRANVCQNCLYCTQNFMVHHVDVYVRADEVNSRLLCLTSPQQQVFSADRLLWLCSIKQHVPICN